MFLGGGWGGEMDGWMDEWMDGWMDEWMDEWMGRGKRKAKVSRYEKPARSALDMPSSANFSKFTISRTWRDSFSPKKMYSFSLFVF